MTRPSHALEPCPACGALFPRTDGPTHPYIGASAGCWALFTPLSVGEEPDAELLAACRAPDRAVAPRASAASSGSSIRRPWIAC